MEDIGGMEPDLQQKDPCLCIVACVVLGFTTLLMGWLFEDLFK